MSLITDFFSVLMEWCHSWCPNYWVDIVIFTLLTKILQFPVALWCQANSLKMVSLMPQTIKIKMDRFGDKDAIGDATAALFKREHYHPLVALVPLAIQIVILLAFVKVIYGIGDRLTVPGVAKPLIACVPYVDGGWSWLMPLAAGAAAWLLGYTQNIYNPLQHEQTRAEQLITNGISIAISLVLGCFVAVGVGLYWAVSNVMAIAVQYLENQCIRPDRHVDYPKLMAAKAALAAFQEAVTVKTEVSREDLAREKRDYKRFFSVANKHLVFYAEGGGYYKYFQSVVEWLLQHSNVVVHYVTNDPKDGVFRPETFGLTPEEYAKRIRAYYIGSVRIIPLFMKMDADMVVMTTPDLGTYQLKRSYVRKDVEYVYIEHGPTSMHMCYRKGALDNFDTIMALGPFNVDEHRATERIYGLRQKKLVEAGYPLFDKLSVVRPTVRSSFPRIMIAPSYQADNILDSCLDELLKCVRGPGRTVVVRPHPQYVRRFPAKMQAIEIRYSGCPDVVFETDFSQPSTMDASDALITDWSCIAYEFSYKTRRPVVFVNTPMKVVNPEWQRLGLTPTDITFRNEVGVAIALPDVSARARQVVDEVLANPASVSEKADRLFATRYFNIGRAAPVIGQSILQTLIAKGKGMNK